MNLMDILGEKIILYKIKRTLVKLTEKEQLTFVEKLLKHYYQYEDELSNSFYHYFLNKIKNNDISFLYNNNIFEVIDIYKQYSLYANGLEHYISAFQYLHVAFHDIKKLKELLLNKLKSVPINFLDELYNEEDIYKISRQTNFSDIDCTYLAYKLYLSIGYKYSILLLNDSYGIISFKTLYFLFIGVDVNNIKLNDNLPNLNNNLLNFLFKDNAIKYVLLGKAKELYLNFAYFYNNFNYYYDALECRLSLKRVNELLKDRFLSFNFMYPEIDRIIASDMCISYKKRNYDFSDEDIYKHNFNFYQDILLNNHMASIPNLLITNNDLEARTLTKSDARNLVMGYRSNNCFRINGEAAILFSKAMKSKHFRVVSVSSKKDSDIAMMLVGRNGNVLIAQGIEISVSYQSLENQKKIYNVCELFMRKLMDKMNLNGDEIVAAIFNMSNENVSKFNRNILPFRIKPILDDDKIYYDGFSFYQCLIALKDNKTLNDIKLFIPENMYYDKREEVVHILANDYSYLNNLVNKRLFAISVQANKQQERIYMQCHHQLKEVYCNRDWFILNFLDGLIYGICLDEDDRAKDEYEYYLSIIHKDKVKGLIDFI